MKMNRLIYTLIALVVLLSGCAHQPKGDTESMRIGVRADVPLVGYYDLSKHRAGSEVRLARKIAAFLGKKPVLVTVTSDNREKLLLSGRVDMVIATFSVTKQRSTHLAFSMPYKTEHQGLMIKSNSTIHKIVDLNGKKIGFVKGATSMRTLLSRQLGIIPVVFDNYYRAMIHFSLGDIDALSTDTAILNGLNLLWSIKQKKLATIDGQPTFLINIPEQKPSGLYRILNETLSDEHYGVAVRKDDKKLLRKVNEYLKKRNVGKQQQ